MKKILLTLFSFALLFDSYGQTILFSENFNSGSSTKFTLNSTDLGSLGAALPNQWVINNDYTGGTGQGIIVCPSFGTVPVAYNSHTTLPQPSAIAGSPNSYYLHITDTSAEQIGVRNATFIIADGLCLPTASDFVKMNSGISTLGHSNISLSFWWICGGDTHVFGKVYYSIDGGNTWLPVNYGLYSNSQTWQQSVLSMPEFGNQPDLRFGFQWVNGVATANVVKDPSFGLDDIMVTADAPPTCNAEFLLYPDTLVPHLWYAVNLSSGTAPVNYVWNWGDGTYTVGATPVHIYSGPGMYNICLSLTDGVGCSSTFCDSAKVYRTDGTPITVNVILPSYPTGTQQVQQNNNITVYPNPSNDNITITGTGNDIISEISITNILGQTVFNNVVNKSYTNNMQLQLPQASGLYFIHLKGQNGDYTGKVVKE